MNQRPKALISARAKKFIANKRWPRVTKPIVVGKTHCELLRSFEVKVCNKWLATNFLALADIRALGR